MKFNYQTEKMKFDARWERLTAEYRRAGMTEKQIAAMRSYDWEEFKREKIFRIHNQFLSEYGFDDVMGDEVSNSPLYCYFMERLSDTDDYFCERSMGWLELIEREELQLGLKSATKEELEIINMYAFEGRTQKEIAEKLRINLPSLTNMIKTIRKN